MLIALFFGALLPVISLRIEVFTTEGERFLYFPSVFFCIFLADVLQRSLRGRLGAGIAVLFILTLYGVSLWKTNRNWVNAARLSRSIVEVLSSHTTTDSVLVLNIPDNLDGAYVFRNGLREALISFSDWRRGANVRVMAWQRLSSANGGAELKVEGHGELSLILKTEGEEFVRIEEGAEVTLVEQGRQRLRLRFEDGTNAVDIFYFGSGRMMKAPERSQ
jgi:protein O-mannosyl-transferase